MGQVVMDLVVDSLCCCYSEVLMVLPLTVVGQVAQVEEVVMDFVIDSHCCCYLEGLAEKH